MTAEWVEAEHDDEALEQARVRCRVGAYEVWDRNRLVLRMNGHSQSDR